MKILLILGVLFSFNTFAEITFDCGTETWNQEGFQGNMFNVEVQFNCQTSLDVEAIDRLEDIMIMRYQEASDVAEVHEVGEKEQDGIKGTYVISNLKQSIPNRGDMNIRYDHFIGWGADETLHIVSASLNIEASGYSRYTKEIILRRDVFVVDGKVHITFREFDRIEKPGIAPRGLFTRAAKKGLADNTKRKIQWLMNYLDQNI